MGGGTAVAMPNVQKNSRALVRGMGGLIFGKKINARKQ